MICQVRSLSGIAAALSAALLAGSLASSRQATADEGGVSLWLPGLFGSMAAAPGVPGWQFASTYYHTSVEAKGGKTFPRGGQVDVGLNARADLVFLNTTYIFATPVLGAQAAFGATVPVGRSRTSVDAVLTGPNGNAVAGSLSDERTAFGDIYPMGTLKWNRGVHNAMVYLYGDIPVGAYNPGRLANVGIGHGGIDSGLGYTYLDQAGREFSVVTGFTYNFKNPDTDYRNGINWHVDWGMSQALSKQVLIGAVGYYYRQITGDSGSGAVLGPFKSRVAGIGPQISLILPAGSMQAFLNFKGYKEFAAENRPEGWNAWATLAISPAPPPPSLSPALVRK